MLKEFNAKFSNFLLSLSDAVDIASPQIASHQIRTSFIAWKIALAAKLPEDKPQRCKKLFKNHFIFTLLFATHP